MSGGRNPVSGVGIFYLNAYYRKNKLHWDNSLKTGYGLTKEGPGEFSKNEDRFDLNSKLGIETKNEHLLFSSFLNFLTQFANGYNYQNTDDKISGILAPAYVTVASGFDYQPSGRFSLFFTPVSGKFTIVTDAFLSETGAFGLDPGENARAEMGATVKCESKIPIFKNVNFASGLMFFSNYFNQPQNIDINWDGALYMKINEFLAANLLSSRHYDHDILIPVDDLGNKMGRMQSKTIFGAGLTYNF